jgi:hypothetical protein
MAWSKSVAMTTEAFRHSVKTLVDQASHDALAERKAVLGKNAQHLENSRMGIVLMEMVRDIAKPLNDALTNLYEITLKQTPNADRSALRKSAMIGLDDFLSQARSTIGRVPAGFSQSRDEVFKSELDKEAVRLRAALELKLRSVIQPAKVGWGKRLKEDHPIVYDMLIPGCVIGGGFALAVGYSLAKMSGHG